VIINDEQEDQDPRGDRRVAEFLYRPEAGIVVRGLAWLVDIAILGFLVVPTYIFIMSMRLIDHHQFALSRWDWLLWLGLPSAVTLLTWWAWQATPGKRLLGVRIVDSASGGRASVVQLLTRYLSYLISALPLGLGFLWIAIDPQRRAWHDKLAGTSVVYRWHAKPSD
jgi:uncharacterized RDD family membrane protein YckC